MVMGKKIVSKTTQMIKDICKSETRSTLEDIRFESSQFYIERKKLLRLLAKNLSSVPRRVHTGKKFTKEDSHIALVNIQEELLTNKSPYELKLIKAINYADEFSERIQERYIYLSYTWPSKKVELLKSECKAVYKSLSVGIFSIMDRNEDTFNDGMLWMLDICEKSLKRYKRAKSCYQPEDGRYEYVCDAIKQLKELVINAKTNGTIAYETVRSITSQNNTTSQ